MMTRLRWLLLTGVAAVLGVTFFVTTRTNAPTSARIAVVMPLGIEIGQQIFNATELAVNQSSLANQVELVAFDTLVEGMEQVGPINIQYTEEIIADPSFIAVIGASASTHAQTTIPMLNQASVPLISPLATAPHLTKPGYRPGAPGIHYPTGERNFFRTIPSDETQGLIAARWLSDEGHTRAFLIVIEGDPYSEGLAGIFEANALEQGIEIVGRYDYLQAALNDQPDLLTSITEAAAEANPDVVYFPLVSQLGNSAVLFALEDALPEVRVMGGDGLTYEPLAEGDLSLLDNLYATTMPAEPTELDSAASFVAAYEDAYDHTPPAFAMTSYDATLAVLAALEQTGPNPSRPAFLAALQSLGPVDGAQGTWQFTETGDIDTLAIRVVRFDNGDWITVDVFR